ncbi:methylated-DNA--[protein]-cysteine S-methyltransferase [Fulvivirga sp. 29W222]|uniref:methylated-DNA--[protein]-cysteine S-methyltransferase n=1 Tax=Fulvivirga marina TaxID=2494733 RepID=A0A937FUN5_9BACT|nr:methylated-DNA--[protein]-cysteine S-methyltransferase [Fulvivirga marina]MBL6444728.1 methylated-DNA--[protein]-cysteine S-methyltransferase [Fulvivirga marina]
MTDYQRIAQAINYIKVNFKQQPTLEQIAESVHLSPYHFQRLFKKWAGVSPKKFLQYLSLEHAKSILSQKQSLEETTFQTGLSGSGRLHDLFVNIEGMTPGEYKNQGGNLFIKYSVNESLFGNYLIASTGKGVCNLLFFDQEEKVVEELKSLWPKAKLVVGEDKDHETVRKFFAKNLESADKVRLHLKGTDFQLKVWEALLKIPEGALVSYGEIANQIKQPTAQRAVGTSIGRNPVGYLIPCHRVIKRVGGIGEYRWGKERKMAIIGWESAQLFGEEHVV